MSFSEFPTVHLLVEYYTISHVDTILATIYSRVDCRMGARHRPGASLHLPVFPPTSRHRIIFSPAPPCAFHPRDYVVVVPC